MKQKNLLTPSEMEVMEILWAAEGPMTSNDALESGKIDGWSSGYLHNVLRSMLKKEIVRVNGMVQNNNQYARLFEPAMTKEEYAAKMALSVGLDRESVLSVALAMAKGVGADDLVTQLKSISKKMK